MRSKAQILRETLTTPEGRQETEAIIVVCIPLIIEVLLDIRDYLSTILTVLTQDDQEDPTFD